MSKVRKNAPPRNTPCGERQINKRAPDFGCILMTGHGDAHKDAGGTRWRAPEDRPYGWNRRWSRRNYHV